MSLSAARNIFDRNIVDNRVSQTPTLLAVTKDTRLPCRSAYVTKTPAFLVANEHLQRHPSS